MKITKRSSKSVSTFGKKRPFILAASIAAVMFAAATGSAHAQLLINANYDATITGRPDSLQIQAGIQAAINQIQSLVTSPNANTVNIKFGYIGSGLGQSISAFGSTLTIAQYEAALNANPGKNALQIAALATMPPGPTLALNNDTNVRITSAQLRTLGQGAAAAAAIAATPSTGGNDSFIQFNFDIINASRLAPVAGKYDLQTVALHEINEAVGGVGGGTTSLNGTLGTGTPPPSTIGALDFFRYSAANTRSFTYNNGTTAYFSINNGTTNLANFNQGPIANHSGGTNSDYADYVSDGIRERVQDAFGAPYVAGGSTGANTSTVELTGYQVDGYNLTALATAPARFWTGIISGGSWTQANWASDVNGTPTFSLPTATDDITFSTAGGPTGTTTLGQNFTIRSLTISDSTAVTLNPGGAFGLTIAGNAGTGIDVQAGAGAVVISSGLALTGLSDTVNVSNAAGLTLTGGLGGSTSFTKTGTGTLTFAATLNNTHTGGMTIQQGTLSLKANLAASFGTIKTTGSVIDYANGVNNAAPIQLASNSTQLQVLVGTATQSGIISQDLSSRPLEKIGAGTLILTRANTYTGITTISGGVLQIGDGVAANAGLQSIQVNVAGGNLDLNLLGGESFNIGVLTNGGTAVRNISAAGTITIGGQITGSGGFTQNGGSRAILTAANTYIGATGVTAGTLQIGNGTSGSIAAASAVSVAGSTFLDINLATGQTLGNAIANSGTVRGIAAGTNTLSGAITGGGAFSQTGAGTTILTNAGNTYGGATTVSNGKLQIGDAVSGGSIGAANPVTVGTGGTLAIVNIGGPVANTLANNITGSAGAGTVLVNSANTNILSGVLSNGGGTLSLTQSGVGTTILSGNNTFSGAVTISAGVLQVGNGGASGTAGIGNGQIFNNATLTYLRSDAYSETNLISGSGIVNKNGGNALTLTRANTYDGATNVNAGTLILGNATALGSAVGGTVVANGATLDLNGQTVVGEKLTSIQGTGVGGFALTNTAGAAASFSGDVTLIGATTIGGAVSNDITLGGSIGGGAQNLTKAGGDRLILNGVNTYTGTTNVTGGELRVNGLLSSVAVTVQSGATLSGTGNLLGAVTIGNGGFLNPGTSPGTITMGSLVLNGLSTSNFELATPGVVGGATNDLVNVTGALTLNGTVNVLNANVAGFPSGSYRLFNYLPGALTIGGLPSTAAGTLTLNGTVANWTTAPNSVSPSVITAVAGQVNLLVLPVGVGPVQYWDGTDAPNNNVVGGGNGSWDNFTNNWTNGNNTPPPATGIGSVNAGWQNGIAVFGGTTPPVNAAVPAGGVNLTDAVNAQGLVFATSGFSISGAGNNTLTLVYVGAPVVAPFINVVGGIATIDAQIKGNQGLWANGTGTLFLNNVTNSFTGGLLVTNGGAVSVTNDSPLGGPGSGITLNNGTLQANGDFTLAAARTVTLGAIAGDTGTIDVTGAHTLAIGGVNQITGNGGLVKIGTGILNLTAANNYIGTTFVSGGTLQVNNDNNLGTVGGITFANNAVLKTTAGITSVRLVTLNAGGGTFDSNGFNSTLSNIIADGAGAPNTAQPFTKAGAGTLTVTAANTYTGQTNVTGGTLQVGDGTSALTKIGNNTGNVVVSIGATLGVNLANTGILANNISVAAAGTISANNAAGTQTLSGIISGAGFLNQDGLGRTLVSGNNVAFTGLTSVNFGTLIVGNANALGTAGLGQGTVVASGATLDLNGQAIIGEPVQIQGAGDAGNGYIGVLANHNGAGGPAASLGGQVSLAASSSIGNNLAAGGDFTLSGFVSGGAGAALTKVGTNMVTLSAVNSYLGTTTVAAGILVAGDASALGNISAGTTVNNGASLMIGNTILTNAEPLTINGAGAATRAGILLTSGALTQQLNGSSTYNGPITAATNSTISTNGTGTLTITAGIIKNGVVLTLKGGGNIKINNVGISGATSFTSDLVVDGTGVGGATVVDANVANSYAGPTWITNGGTFNANVLGALPSPAADGGIGTVRTTVVMDPVAAIVGSSAPAPSTGSSKLNLSANQAIQALISTNATSQVNLNTSTLTIGFSGAPVAPTVTPATFAGIISGANAAGASIIKDGTSTQIFSGPNTYTGSTTVNGGTLQAGIITQAFGINSAVTVGAAGTLDLAGFSNTIGSLAGAVGAKVQSTGGVATLTTGALNTPSTDYAGQLLDGAGGQLLLIKNGTGIQVLSGTAANTYTGLTLVNSGEIDLNKTAGLNAIGGNLTIGDGAGLGANTDIVKLLASNQIIDTSVVLINGSTGRLDLNNFSETILSFADTGAVIVDGSSVNLGSGTLTFGDGTATTFSGAITGVGGNLIKNGTGTMTFAGTTTANTFSGLTTVNAGQLDLNKTPTTLAIGGNLTIGDGAGGANSDIVRLLAANQIIDTSVVLINGSSGRLDLNNFNETIAVLADTGVVTVDGSSVNVGTGILTYGDATNRTFSGAITGTAPGRVFKQGTGTETLSGTTTANTFSGSTIVNAGELDLNKTAGTLAIGGNLSIGDGAGPGLIPTANSDIVKLLASNQIIDTSVLSINATTGRLDLNNQSETVGSVASTGAFTLGGSTINLGSGTLTTGGLNTSTTYSGVIGGVTGNLTKVGGGTFTLSGLNTYTGVTTVTGGTLQAASTQAFGINSAVIVGPGATLDLAGNSNSIGSLADVAFVGGIVQSSVGPATLTTGGDNTSTTFFGTVQDGVGPLSLVKNGTGTQTLGGPNSYTGTTTVNAGTLLAASGPTAFGNNSAVTVNGGTLDIGGNDNTIGSLAGGGGTVQSSFAAGTLTTGGLNTNTTYSGVVQDGAGGTFALVKNGTGFQTLSGTNSYTGGTTLNAGTLAAGSTKAFGSGNVTVTGGTLQTVGGPRIVDIGGGNIAINGGTALFNVGGTTAGVTHDQILTTGTVGTINGTLTLVQQNGYLLQPGDKVNLMVAGTVTGGSKGGTPLPAGKVIGLSAFSITPLLVPTVNLYADPSVTLEAMQGSFSGLNGQIFQGVLLNFTPNQIAVATALDSLLAQTKGKTGLIKELNYLDTQPLSTLKSNLDKIAPEELTAIFNIGVQLANVSNTNLQRRMEDIRIQSAGGGGVQSAPADNHARFAGGPQGPVGRRSKEITPPNDDRWGMFLTGAGEFTHIGSTTNAAGYNLTTGGVTAGLDYRVNQHFAIGLNLGYANTSASLVNGGNLQVDGGNIGLYATYFDQNFHMDLAVGGGLNSYKTRRVTPNNTIATGSPNGSEFNVLFALGYDWKFGALTIGPTASLQYTNTSMDRFTEFGAFAPLTIASKSSESIRTNVGIRAYYDGHIGKVGFRPEVRLAWQHEAGAAGNNLTSNFATLGGAPFTVAGTTVGRDSLLASAGFIIMWNDRLGTYVYYDGQFGASNQESHSVSGGFRLQF